MFFITSNIVLPVYFFFSNVGEISFDSYFETYPPTLSRKKQIFCKKGEFLNIKLIESFFVDFCRHTLSLLKLPKKKCKTKHKFILIVYQSMQCLTLIYISVSGMRFISPSNLSIKNFVNHKL